MTIEELSARLEKVERANRRLRAGGIVALVLVAAGAAMGQAARGEKVVQAREFQVLDKAGKPRASFGAGEDGSPVLCLNDEGGRFRALLGLQSDGTPGLWLNDKDGQGRARFALRSGDSPELALSDSGGKDRVGICVSGQGNGSRPDSCGIWLSDFLTSGCP